MGVEGSFIPAGILADYPALPEQDRAPDGVAVSEIDAIDGAPSFAAKWPDAISNLYKQEVEDRLYREQHFLFVLGFITCLVTVALDALIAPAMVTEGAVIRILTAGPITLLGMLAAEKRWTKTLTVCVGAAPIAFVAAIIHLSFHLPPQFAASYLTATTLVLAMANVVLPFTIAQVARFSLFFIAAAIVILALGPKGALEVRSDYVLLLCVVAAATIPLAMRFEQLRQRNFLLNLRSLVTARELREANQQLQDLSEQDPLTGALNRRGFARVFDERIARFGKDAVAGRAALIMVDIDHFKHFNDTHGHQAGDTCLSMVSAAVQSIISDTGGMVARYGGEEFVAALREEFPGHAQKAAEEIREAVAGLLVPVGDEHGPSGRSLVTASLGVGVGETIARRLSSEDCDAMREELIEMADAALYAAKHAGRNCVEVVSRADPIARTA